MSGANALVDYFLKVEGLPGDSTDVQHKGEFEIKDWSFGVENKSTIGSATGGAGAGKVKFNEFTIKKTSDKASPLFFKNCASGAHYKKVILTVRKAGGDPTNAPSDFLKVTFSDVLTSRYIQTGQRLGNPPPPPVDVVVAPTDTVGGQVGGTTDNGDETPQDNISFKYAKLQESVDAMQIPVRPISAGILAFDPATNTFKMSDAPGGVFPVGSAGGIVSRAAMEFDNVAILIGLLTAPFSTATLTLGIQEIREAAINPGAQNAASVNTPGNNSDNNSDKTSDNSGSQRHLFDVILYTPADGALTVEDLTRPGKRIGTLTVDPSAPPTSLDIELGNLVTHQQLDAFGIRIQLRGARLPDLNEDKNDEQDDPDVSNDKGSNDNSSDDRAQADGQSDNSTKQNDGGDNHNGDDKDKKGTQSPDFSASFTANLVFNTA